MIRESTIPILLILLINGCTPSLMTSEAGATTSIDFEVHDNIIVVEAYVNSKWSKFIVDTGASVSLLDFTQSKKYDFTYSVDPDKRLTGFGGKSRLMRTSDVSFRIKGEEPERLLSFSASDLSQLNVILSQAQQRVLGILGNDFLEMHSAVIDYKRKKLSIASLY